jgi:hypothetical protein
VSFYTGTQAELLYSLTSPVTKNTYTTQAVLSALAAQPKAAVPGGFFAAVPNGVGRGLLLKAAGTAATTSAATLAVAVGWDSTPGTLGTSLGTVWPALAPTAAVTVQWDLESLITCTAVGGSTGVTLAHTWTFSMTTVASGTTTTTTDLMVNKGFASTAGLGNEGTNYVELLGTWSASAAGNTTTLQQMLLFGLN